MTQATYPAGWLNSEPYHPEQHLSRARKSSAKDDYLNVAQRLVWFIREQRQMIAAGAATGPFVIKTRVLELDSEKGFCTCEATIRDCLGNEASDIGTETKADFQDYAEKAATKAKGRALASLGYGTQFAPELDEGERIVDTPIVRREKIDPPLTKDEIKAGLAALGYHGTAWIEIACQTTGKTREQLAKGFSADDLAKLQKRYLLLSAGAERLAKANGVAANKLDERFATFDDGLRAFKEDEAKAV